MLLLKLALVNITRNPRRSVITVLAVAVGLAALIFLWGFSDGTNEQMRENVINLFTGHIQIHESGFQKSLAPELTVSSRQQILQSLNASKQVNAYAERLKCEALIGTTEHARGVMLTGIDPAQETAITNLQNYISEGSFLDSGDDRSVLIGYRLAEKIHVALGDKVVIMTQAMDGTLSGYAFYVKGVFHTGSQSLDEVSAYVTLPASRDLLGIEEGTHEIVLKLGSRRSIPSIISELKALPFLDRHEILPWNELVPEVEQWVQWSEAIIRTILVAVMIVIGVSIMNTVLMSVFERTRELGVMMAIGTSPRQILGLIVTETLILELLGLIVGLIAGLAVTSYFGHAGIAFHDLEQAFSRSYMSTVTYTRIQPVHILESIVTLILMTTFIGLYPAWKAARMEPVKAIYHS